jgi:hypothetical protein
MYKYYLLLRGRSIGTQPDGYVGWTDYTEQRFVPEIGRNAWGELYYDNKLTDREVKNYELFDAGPVTHIEYMDGYKTGGIEMRGIYNTTIGGSGKVTINNPKGNVLDINF